MLNRSTHWLGKRFSFYYRHVRSVPEAKKVDLGGEDAFLSLVNVQSVLDGVSWWKENTGVTAGLYSAALARSMYEYIGDELLGDAPASSLRLLEHGYDSCKQGDVFGTCTALVATLQEPQIEIQAKDRYELVLLEGPSLQLPSASKSAITDTSAEDAAERLQNPLAPPPEVPTSADLHSLLPTLNRSDGVENYLLDVAFVGDCSVMIVRGGRVLYVSEEQSHSLDYPFQLGTGSVDTPCDGVRRLIPVEKGDLVVMGSDGLFDNLYPNQIATAMWGPLEMVYRQHGYIAFPGDDPRRHEAILLQHARSRNLRALLVDDIMAALKVGAKAVMQAALRVANDIHGNSPYASKCIEQGALFEGGKPDDMTLLASVVGEDNDDEMGDRFTTSETTYPPPYRDWP